jgi:hypothetical protein
MTKSVPGHVEQAAGKPAQFKVFYRRNGKLYWDAIWAPGSDEAISNLQAFAKELRWQVTVVRVERIDPVV